jgi:hypothetical protein
MNLLTLILAIWLFSISETHKIKLGATTLNYCDSNLGIDGLGFFYLFIIKNVFIEETCGVIDFPCKTFEYLYSKIQIGSVSYVVAGTALYFNAFVTLTNITLQGSGGESFLGINTPNVSSEAVGLVVNSGEAKLQYFRFVLPVTLGTKNDVLFYSNGSLLTLENLTQYSFGNVLSVNYIILRVDVGDVRILNFVLKMIEFNVNNVLLFNSNVKLTIVNCVFDQIVSRSSFLVYKSNDTDTSQSFIFLFILILFLFFRSFSIEKTRFSHISSSSGDGGVINANLNGGLIMLIYFVK